MRTTIRIDDDLYRRVKAHAARSGRSVGEVIEDAVRVALQRRPPAPDAVPDLPVFDGTGTLDGIDLADNRSLADAMDREQHEGGDLAALR